MSTSVRDFVLPVDKPPGPTSHDVVAVARRALGERRIGHTGTLDPFASGLLLLCVGRATRLAEFLSGLDKRYEARARLGVATDTLDLDGAVTAEDEGWRALSRDDVERALASLRGPIRQVPPAFSAKKVEGVAAHRRARAGSPVALPPQEVTVHELDITLFEPPCVELEVRCTSGTYVRALARDLGEMLGVGAHLTALRRTAVGTFGVDGALTLDDLSVAARVSACRIAPLDALAHLPCVQVDERGAGDLRHGRPVRCPGSADAETAVASWEHALLAVGGLADGTFKPRKVFTHD